MTNSTQSQNLVGHVVVAVAAGVAQVYDCQKHQTIEVEEIIYDQGAGKYAAMPIDDVYDYFILDVKLQKRKIWSFWTINSLGGHVNIYENS